LGCLSSALVIGVIAIAAWPLSWSTGRKSGLGITTPFQPSNEHGHTRASPAHQLRDRWHPRLLASEQTI